MQKQLVISLAFGIFVFGCTSEIKQSDQTSASHDAWQGVLSDFEGRISEDVNADGVGSISVAVFDQSGIRWSKVFGKANSEPGVLADSLTVYRAASITKTVTAYLMMLLVQDGTIDLDEPVLKYIPELSSMNGLASSSINKITFRHLASHTSGLDREPQLIDAASGPFTEWETKLIGSIPTTQINTEPGENYGYSNIGYGILGLALARATERPYTEMVQEKVLEPLRMTNSYFSIPDGGEKQVATGYKYHPFTGKVSSEQSEREHLGRGYKVPNGGLYTTAHDLALFMSAQCGGKGPLSAQYVKQMQAIQTPESSEYGYGFGYYIRNDNGIEMVEHDGGVAGYNAYMVFNPETCIGVVLLRNYNFGLTNVLLEPRRLLRQLVNIQANGQ